MSTHTPGNWWVRNNGPHWNNPEITNWDICWSPDGERVAEHVYEEADARLMAAAPELLEALVSVLDSLGAMTNRHELNNRMHDADAANVWAAIAKATQP